jgi:hypothetical protein
MPPERAFVSIFQPAAIPKLMTFVLPIFTDHFVLATLSIISPAVYSLIRLPCTFEISVPL